jgi:hypothetical protein
MTLDEQYEEWMFERFAGIYCKDSIIEMCENSHCWEDFLEEVGEKNELPRS